MNLADKLTTSRLVLAPVFFAVYRWGAPLGAIPYVSILWGLFLLIEVSDLLDGYAARRADVVSDFGKLFDPYADVFARLTYFVCFVLGGIMPAWVFIIIIYREFSINFLRMLLAQRGITMGARSGGKLKSATYMAAGAASLLLVSAIKLDLFASIRTPFAIGVYALYSLAAFLSVLSFIDYFIQFRKLTSRS
jgi:CDP-diacylglycerol--glycerol-3-phosphate 3-phosphatidyltransferase